VTVRRDALAAVVCAAIAIGTNSRSQDAQRVSRVTTDFPDEVSNLKVLPEDISHARLKRLMRGYESDLGVSCRYCHVEDRDTGIVDYASDENPRKQTARVMITMVDSINGDFLARLGGDTRYANPVTCGSCHQGHSSPLEFQGH
jgi:hypothetical protein